MNKTALLLVEIGTEPCNEIFIDKSENGKTFVTPIVIKYSVACVCLRIDAIRLSCLACSK